MPNLLVKGTKKIVLIFFSELFAALEIAAPIIFYSVGFIAVLVTAVSKSGFGGAVALGIPMLLLVTSPRIALAVTLPILLIIDVWVVFFSNKKIDYKLLIIMLIFGLLGHFFGWYFFDYISNTALVMFISLMSLITVFSYFRKRFFPVKLDIVSNLPFQKRPLALWSWGGFWCTLSGIASFISVSGGIPLQIFLMSCKLPRHTFIGSAGAFFFILNLTKVPLYWDLGILSKSTGLLSLSLLPAIPLGITLGQKINNKISDDQFYLLLHIILGIVGLQLLYSVIV
ncbi:MAG: sulfite exporter TauE/SafE family protein [Candidatus Puniceispirillaceae bacterium]